MVEHADVHQGQGILESPGEGPVGVTRLAHAGRVVVGEDHRRRVSCQRPLDHFAGMDAGPVNGAPEQFLAGDDPVAVVQEQAGEDLVWYPRNRAVR